MQHLFCCMPPPPSLPSLHSPPPSHLAEASPADPPAGALRRAEGERVSGAERSRQAVQRAGSTCLGDVMGGRRGVHVAIASGAVEEKGGVGSQTEKQVKISWEGNTL